MGKSQAFLPARKGILVLGLASVRAELGDVLGLDFTFQISRFPLEPYQSYGGSGGVEKTVKITFEKLGVIRRKVFVG